MQTLPVAADLSASSQCHKFTIARSQPVTSSSCCSGAFLSQHHHIVCGDTPGKALSWLQQELEDDMYLTVAGNLVVLDGGLLGQHIHAWLGMLRERQAAQQLAQQ